MSDTPKKGDLAYAAIEFWLRGMGVLCGCDDGWRKHEHSYLRPGDRVRVTDTIIEPCDRCTLVEVGGIRVRWLRNRSGFEGGNELVCMPAVEATDD